MEPLALSAAAATTIFLTKALEKSGEVFAESAVKGGGQLVKLLKERFPTALFNLEQAKKDPKSLKNAVIEMENAAKQDSEVQRLVESIANVVRPQISANREVQNFVTNNYGGNVGSFIQNDNRTQNFQI